MLIWTMRILINRPALQKIEKIEWETWFIRSRSLLDIINNGLQFTHDELGRAKIGATWSTLFCGPSLYNDLENSVVVVLLNSSLTMSLSESILVTSGAICFVVLFHSSPVMSLRGPNNFVAPKALNSSSTTSFRPKSVTIRDPIRSYSIQWVWMK